MLMLHLLAEQRIEEAMREGAFDDLPGTGRPLELDDDRWVPQDSRVAFRILKNAGFVPPEIQTRKEIADLNRLLAIVTDDGERDRARARLALLQAMLDNAGRGSALRRESGYRARIAARFGMKA